MKVLACTKLTQGRRRNDFSHAADGELVTYGSECDGEKVDGGCGCKRSLIGMDSNRATTTFAVATRKDIETREQVAELVKGMLQRGGWLHESFGEESNKRMLEALTEDTWNLWTSFNLVPDGTVVERRGKNFNARVTATSPVLRYA